MHRLSHQRAFLVELARLEKSQPDESVVVTGIVFLDGRVQLDTSNGRTIDAPIDADALSLQLLLGERTPGIAPITADVFARYPESGTRASMWAELHYDLGRSEFLDQLNALLRYQSIYLDGTVARIEIRDELFSAQLELDFARVGYPIHVPSDLGELWATAPHTRL